MAWIDNKKAYDFIPHSWINELWRELFGIADNVRNFLEKSMEQWKLSLMSNGEDLGEVDVKRGISGRQPFTTVVCFEYGTFVYIWGKKEYKLHICFSWMI